MSSGKKRVCAEAGRPFAFMHQQNRAAFVTDPADHLPNLPRVKAVPKNHQPESFRHRGGQSLGSFHEGDYLVALTLQQSASAQQYGLKGTNRKNSVGLTIEHHYL